MNGTASTFITAQELRERLASAAGDVIVDTRFWLSEPERGRAEYLAGHMPSAVYAHLDEDLSGPVIPGRTGRHPLPDPESFAATAGGWGIDGRRQVIAYDQAEGGIAARLWWMLRWLGHDAVAVLDGGWQAWLAAGHPVEAKARSPVPARFTPRPRAGMLVSTPEIMAMRRDPAVRIFDARGADRFAGQNETIDPVAGHIPGAVSAPYLDSAGPDGRSRSPESLRAAFEALLAGVPADGAVVYCGSGVTACRSLLAMEHAGLPGARLYAGSWSEYIHHSSEIETGGP